MKHAYIGSLSARSLFRLYRDVYVTRNYGKPLHPDIDYWIDSKQHGGEVLVGKPK